MEDPKAKGALAWLDSRPEVQFVPDSSGPKPTVPVVKRALQLRAGHEFPVIGDMWWLVEAPELAIPSGIVTGQILALTGRNLGWSRFGGLDCAFNQNGQFPLAGLLYYQGQAVDGAGAGSGAPEVAGYTALVKYHGENPFGIQLLAIHVSPAGVSFGYCLTTNVVQFLHDAEERAYPRGGCHDLRYAPAVEAAEEACKSLAGLASHVQM